MSTPGPAAPALPAAAAGLAVLLAATALSGVLSGDRWFGFAIVAVAVVAATGVLLRSLRWPPVLVTAGQLAALTGLVTAVFTRSGVLAAIPGPDALRELHAVLGGAAAQVRFGVPPVPETTELLCLVVIALGLVAVAVDTLAISAAAPAASGLVLLGVFAVPASLADELLPWWTFMLGAVGFTLLLTVDSQRRHMVWGAEAGPGGRAGAVPAAAAVGAGAVALSLLVGAAFTTVGTEVRLPGSGPGSEVGSSGIGLNPFTSLRGQLDSGTVVDLFRVHGLTDRTYLRALTLSRFEEGQGWVPGRLDGTAAANGDVPLPPGISVPLPGPVLHVQIEPIDYVDSWLPAFGVPLGFRGVGPEWRYDPGALTAFSDRRQRAQPYIVHALLPQPSLEQLRSARDPGAGVSGVYLDTGGVDPRVGELAARLAAGTDTAFDATLALNRFFTQPGNGFSYDLQTAPGTSGDALLDFLFEGRTGYCEQYASAMAIMLRTLGIPARVAIGFTPGITTGDSRLITTEDAHAWVEAWFPQAGWLAFDPTPLSDGRSVMPPYVAAGDPALLDALPAPTGQQAPVLPTDPETGPSAAAGPGTAGGDGSTSPFGLVAFGVVLLVALAMLSPAAARQARRRQRLRLVGAGGPDAASAAWEEVIAESRDRGLDVPASETVRITARRLAREHGLDEAGRTGLRSLVGALERSWYGAGARGSDPALPAALDAVRASLARCAPTARWARMLPRSVLHPRHRNT
ncbi:MAG: transglutaminase TgpA family protein [Pseudonocardiaceae bacterium]